MAVALTPGATRDYVLQAERELPPEQRSVFVLRAVPLSVRAQFGMLLGRGAAGDDPFAGSDPAELSRLYVLALRTSLVGWRNFRTADGADVPFQAASLDVNGQRIQGAPTDATLDLLDTATMAELGAAALQSMVLGRHDALG